MIGFRCFFDLIFKAANQGVSMGWSGSWRDAKRLHENHPMPCSSIDRSVTFCKLRPLELPRQLRDAAQA
jgi:hypothetical protein